MKRNKHSLSHYKLLTCDMGELVPVGVFEVLPGDSVQQATSALIRVSPLVAPVMHPVVVRFHSWFVPYRILWDGWEDFITGGADGEGGDADGFPILVAGGGGFGSGGLLDYLGVPPTIAGLEVSALPVRAYNKVWNEFYRDQDLQTELAMPTDGDTDTTSPIDVQKVNWEKDYFTAARPWTQKGPDVTLPIGTFAPVKGGPAVSAGNYNDISVSAAKWVYAGLGTVADAYLYADLNSATGVNINTVREAFAVQRYQEARARYGSRYVEYLRYLGVRSSDGRLQRPEYLGGGKQTISFSEIVQTGPDSSDEGVADLKGHGIAALRSRRYRRFFEEHGVVLTLMSVRPRSMYVNGYARMWSRRIKEDFWQKELEHIGQQEIYRREIYSDGSAGDDDVFGYTDRYAEYRHIQSSIAADMRNTLAHWHMARILGSAPTLNSSFIECEPSKRVHAVQTDDVLWVMCSHSIQARRMVAGRSGGVVL